MLVMVGWRSKTPTDLAFVLVLVSTWDVWLTRNGETRRKWGRGIDTGWRWELISHDRVRRLAREDGWGWWWWWWQRRW